MLTIDADGCPIHVEFSAGANPIPLMLSNSLGTTLHMWDNQVQPFSARFPLLRYDRRGHGKSGVPKGPYTMERLGRDVLAILDALKIEKVNWCGLSMGGMVGMWLGANAPERVNKLILSNTSAYYTDKQPWAERINAVREGGVKAISNRVIHVWLTKDFQAREPEKTKLLIEMMESTPVEGYIGCCEAVRDMDHREIIREIKAPTLIIAGQHDPATNLEAAEFLRSRIPGATLKVLDAAHISNVERPQEYADMVLKFLE